MVSDRHDTCAGGCTHHLAAAHLSPSQHPLPLGPRAPALLDGAPLISPQGQFSASLSLQRLEFVLGKWDAQQGVLAHLVARSQG